MNIYVAARFNEKDMVQDLYRELTGMGHKITADWTKHANVKPYNEHPEKAGAYSVEDLDGVLNSDVFIYITSLEVGAGLSAELGAALASHARTGLPKIFVVGDYAATNAFHYHPYINRVANINEAIDKLTR